MRAILDKIDFNKGPLTWSRDVGFEWMSNLFELYSIQNNKRCYSYSESFKIKTTQEDVYSFFESLGMTLVAKTHSNFYGTSTFLYTKEDSCLSVTFNLKEKLSLTVGLSTIDEEFYLKAREYCKSIKDDTTTGQVFVITQSGGDLDMTEIGLGGVTFEKNNYAPKVAEYYDHVKDDLKSKTPCGRIVLLDGPPGTGKTHWIRGLINDVSEVLFIIIPSEMVQSLSGPNLISFLTNTHFQYKKPIVLVVEDADQCLDARRDIGSISTILNLSDGIIGTLLDLRLVLTTNIDIEKIDEAILRPGRLCKRMEFGELNSKQASAIYSRLTGKDVSLDGEYSLAEIYKMAKSGEVPSSSTKKGLGFGR